MESPSEKTSLADIAIAGESYTIAEPIALQHLVGQKRFATLALEIGDVIVVRSTSERHGISFTTTKYPEDAVIVSPRQAASIKVA
jgi:hypothetical protein